ncbi:MAG: hypothetical protein IPG06_15600 [Haliea sp.]|nr:hypothetical protein [Haliea sp.]
MKRLAVIFVSVLALVLVLAAAGGIWLAVRVNGHLTPPPDPAGQQSIASYASAAPSALPAVASAPPPAFSWSTIAYPPISARPWTRWWWPGGDVTAEGVSAQLRVLDEAGFGGVEVQPFLSGMIVVEDEKVMDRVYSFDTEHYYQVLRAGIEMAGSLGMQFDLTNFSGWPPGGPQINLQDSLTILAYAETAVTGTATGETVRVELPRPSPGPAEYIFSMIEFSGADFMNFPVEHARLLSVVAARATAGEHARSPFNLDDTVALDPGSLLVLTDRVEDGVLKWEAPEGNWTVIASYLLPSGEVPMGAAQKPQGFVVDHLRTPQVLGQYEYAFGARTGLPEHYGKGLRGFFNDSLEFRLRRMGVEDILQEFQARRGYDLAPYLPAIYMEGVDNMYFKEILGMHAAPEFAITPLDDRIRHDYQQTLSDLVIERFVESSASWAQERGLTSRAQSYGMDLDIIRALGANTIPETEQLWAGGADTGLKFASSAAALYGRNLVSAESFVWINRDYTTTARRIKAAADKLFLAGINHIIYHGTPYAWRGVEPGPSGEKDSPYGEEGWAPFSGPDNPGLFSGNVSPGNTALWPDVPQLNAYIARSQNLLRQGSPVIDVLIYYPFLGFHGPNPGEATPEALVGGALPDADPAVVASENPTLSAARKQLDDLFTVPPHTDARVAWVEQLQPLLRELDRHGISWGWVNDHALQTGKLAAGNQGAQQDRFGAVVLPNIDSIEPATLAALTRLVDDGVPVLFSGSTPARQPGFKDSEQGDQRVQEGVQRLLSAGAWELAFDAQAWLPALAAVVPEAARYQHASAIKRHRRLLPDGGTIEFFANQGATPQTLTLQLTDAKPLWWFDALEGVGWPVEAQGEQLQIALAGFESRFLVTGIPFPGELKQQQPAGMALQQSGKRWPLQDWEWVVGDYMAADATLVDWREVAALRHARGPGLYRHQFALDEKRDGARYVLDLGLVQGSASVTVNGQDVGRASIPPFAVDITGAIKPGENTIEIALLAPLRNYFVGRALSGDPHYSGMENYEHALVAAGLMGPVAIVEVGPEKP